MRSPIYSQSLAAIGTAKWQVDGTLVLPLDYIQLAFGVTAGGILSQDNNAITYSYFLTPDDNSPDALVPCSISQTTTTITVTDPNLQARGGVAAGDIVRITGTGPTTDGWYTIVTAPSPTTYTVTSGTSQSVSATGGYHAYFRIFAAPAAITGATTRLSAAISHSTTAPWRGLVLKATARTAGSLVGVVIQGAGPA